MSQEDGKSRLSDQELWLERNRDLARSLVPAVIRPYDPAIIKAIKGRDADLRAKLVEMAGAGTYIRPRNIDIGEIDVIRSKGSFQTFSRSGEVVFHTWGDSFEQSLYTARYDTGDEKPLLYLSIIVKRPGKSDMHLSLHNLVKAGVYKRLQKDVSQGVEKKKELKDFERREFTWWNASQVKKYLKLYLDSQLDMELNQERFDLLSSRGRGVNHAFYEVIKLF